MKPFYFLRDRLFRIKNTKFWNYVTWNFLYNWSRYGEEWTKSEVWKKALVDEIIYPNINKDSNVLEIGPGGGRWTEYLAKKARRLILADISPKCIKICKRRFKNCTNIDYFATDGQDLSFILDDSIDFIWSFDAFVHISPGDTALYIKEFRRILKDGAKGVVHHGMEGGRNGPGWRSELNDKLFKKMLSENHLDLISQFDSWGSGKFNVRFENANDILSFFKK